MNAAEVIRTAHCRAGLTLRALAALPEGIPITAANRRELEADGQSRLWWGATPVDVFFNTTPYHEAVLGVLVRYLGGEDHRAARRALAD